MRQIRICDRTMQEETAHKDRFSLTFKEKTEVAALLDRIGTDVIELPAGGQELSDILQLKAIGAAVKNSVLAVCVKPERENIDLLRNALQDVKKKRLVLALPVSTVQMEYGYRLKADGMLKLVRETLEYMGTLDCETEFDALDATRADRAFLYEVLNTAVRAGAKTVTVTDQSGSLLPEEFGAFIRDVLENTEISGNAVLGAGCANTITMAGACLVTAMAAGAGELKAGAFAVDGAFLNDISRVIFEKGEALGISCGLKPTETAETIGKIRWMCKTGKSRTSAFDNGVPDLEEEEPEETDETEVPEVYKIDSYTINTGSIMTSTAHIRLAKNGRMLEEVVLGDGPIDASFLAIERITGRHYELEDFQIRAISEGREALGQAAVKLRGSQGLYSGVGKSTDIIGACIIAYVNALNKIADKEPV